jgi:uncharacterized membrane protein
MSGVQIGLMLSVFLACAVEAVEAVTIVLAVGSTRSWSSALSGVGAATLALAGIVAALGPALTALPIDALRVLVGGLLLIFGLQWLRKAILRAAGLKAKHDELKTFREQTEAARAAQSRPGFDGYSFAIAFKGVLLEGLETSRGRRRAGGADRGGRRRGGARATCPGPGEHDEVGRRRDAHIVWNVLGRRGCRDTLAGR